ncbi:MAG: hypothetical protein K6E49_06045 [Lachnospiraceae bacterium]|nr:hypothetical protein [Lachnospiraceae bacterium]
MKKKITTIFTTVLLTALMCVPVFGSETETDSADNVFVSGDSVSLPGEEFFSGFACGSNVDIGSANAEGSVFAAGQQVTGSGSTIAESLYAAGNSVNLNNTEVTGNIYAAGNQVSIIGNSAGNGVYLAGNSITFEGEARYIAAAGSSVSISGTVDGDVFIAAESVDIVDGTVITGKLTVESSKEPDIPRGVEMGDYSFELSANDEDAGPVESFSDKLFGKVKSCLYWMIAMAGFGMILVWLFNPHLESAASYLKTRLVPLAVSGIVGWLCIPVAALIICCSYIFAPVGGLIFSAYVFLIWIGLAFAGASLSKLVFPKMNPFLSALIGIAALEALRVVPFIGTVIGIAADMYLIGYVIQRLWINRMKKKPAVSVEALPEADTE